MCYPFRFIFVRFPHAPLHNVYVTLLICFKLFWGGNRTKDPKKKPDGPKAYIIIKHEIISICGVSRFGLAVNGLVSRGTSVRICFGSPFSSKVAVCVRIRFGSPFSSKVAVCGHCLCVFVPHSLRNIKNTLIADHLTAGNSLGGGSVAICI